MRETAEWLIREIESHSTEDLVAMQDEFGCSHYARHTEFAVGRGDGSWIYDKNGRRYADYMSTYSTNAGGHVNRELIEAFIVLARTLGIPLHGNSLFSSTQPLLLKALVGLTGLDKALIMNTGAEAFDTAVKIARRWAYEKKKKAVAKGCAEIIVCASNFHGRTLAAISASDESHYQRNFGPLLPGFVHVPFGDIDALRSAITENTAAFILEPIQCEGGMIIPPRGYLESVRDLCTEKNVLMITDEVQTGLGRTGKLFACDHDLVTPDMVLLGKALGQIIPVSAVVGKREVMKVLDPGSHGSTFGGTSIACGVALASLYLLTRNNSELIRNSAHMGRYFLRRLKEIDSPLIKEVRGRGLLIGVEIDPSRTSTRVLIKKLHENQVISGDAHGRALRFTPALTISKDEIDWGLPRIAKALAV